MLNTLLAYLNYHKYNRDEQTEELFKSTFKFLNLRLFHEHKRLSDDSVAHTFHLGMVYVFTKGVNLCACERKPSFIVYDLVANGNDVPSTYIMFFKFEDTIKIIDFIDEAVVENVLSK